MLSSGFVALLGAVPAPATDEVPGLRFRWSLGTLITGPDSLHFSWVRQDTTLKSGDYLKIFIETPRPCHVYLVYRDPHGQVVPFFAIQRRDGGGVKPHFTFGPWLLASYDNGDDTFYFPPVGAEWMSLDENTGQERFYLLASSQPLEKLHALLAAIRTAPARRQADLSSSVLAEIERLQRLQQENGAITEKLLPAPASAGAPAPSPDADAPWVRWDRLLPGRVLDVTAKDLYIRPLTIEHIRAAAQTPPTAP